MTFSELISKLLPITEQLISPGGVEGKLAQERFKKRIGLIFAATGTILQFIILAINGNVDSIRKLPYYLNNFKDFLYLVLTTKWDLAANYELAVELSGIVVLFAGLTVYLFFSLRSAYRQYSEEPFQYTFWVEPFKHVEDTEKEKFKIEPQDRFHHLHHHDLMERLNERIRRLSLLDVGKLNDTPLTSHIHIEGHYAIREARESEWVIHVMPRLRIGSLGSPATLSSPVKFNLDEDEIKKEIIKDDEFKFSGIKLNANKYNQILERVYSSVATEIYRQIECDLKEKIKLFPTKYLRAVALYNEAKDFARSNTVDAYDRAIELYRESIRYFKVSQILNDRPSFKPSLRFLIKRLRIILLHFPLLWRIEVKFIHMEAKIQIGYAKCLIYRREISALSGRDKNPLFGIRENLDEVMRNLSLVHSRINRKWKLIEINELDDSKNTKNMLHTIMAFLTFPSDSWWRRIWFKPDQSLFERQNMLLFDTFLVSAYTYQMLGAFQKAVRHLDNAKAVDPQLSDKSALYHLVAGTIEPDVDKALLLFRRAVEIAPEFQMAQYLLAYYAEMKLRKQDETGDETRVKNVIKEYDKVLAINPGNIAALSAQGYLLWLLSDPSYTKSLEEAKEKLKELKEAKKKFEEGCEIKAISSQTYIGELNYGLARIAAEEGNFSESYDKFTEAVSVDPGIAAYSESASRYSVARRYDYIGLKMLERYKYFKDKVINNVLAKIQNRTV